MVNTDKIGHINSGGGINSISAIAVNVNGLIGTVPLGQELIQVVVEEKGGDNVSINLGTAALGTQIANLYPIIANQDSAITVTYYIRTGISVYISSPAWGASSLDIYLILGKIH